MALTDLLPANSSAKNASNFVRDRVNPVTMVANGRNYLDTLANKYILKPVNARGIGGFVFDYEGETVVTHQAEITDHYSEQNTFINDHAAQKPGRIVLRGFVGEIVANPNTGVLGALATLQGKLTTLPAILGKYTPSVTQKIAQITTQATNVVNKIDNAISRAQNMVGLFLGSSPAPTRQEKAYQQLYGLYLTNTIFTLVTPFNYFQSLMIESMTFEQPEDTKQWAEISVTVKEVRFTQAGSQGDGLSPQLAAQTQAGRSVEQSQGQTNQGRAQGTQKTFDKVKTAFATA